MMSCDNTSKEKRENAKRRYVYTGKVNTEKGLDLRIDKNINSEIIIKIPFNAEIRIISFTNRFKNIKSLKKSNSYGNWVKVEYLQKDNNYIEGYVLDNFLDYQFEKEYYSSKIKKDTVTVKNEKEFVNALKSNRVIWVDTEVINLSKYIRETKLDKYLFLGEEDKVYFNEETVFYRKLYDVISFSLYKYKNIEIRGKNRQVNFIVNDSLGSVINFVDCINFLIDNINFHHELTEGNIRQGEVVSFINCSFFYFQNSHFNGGETVGASIYDNDTFNFLNCEFYNNFKYALKISNSEKINFIRCDFHNNELLKLLVIEETDNIFFKDCFVVDNIVSSNLVEVKGGELNIIDSKVEYNLSGNNNYIFNCSSESKIYLKNTDISNNKDFYGFINDTKYLIRGRGVLEENISDRSSDTVATKFNSYTYKGEKRILRRYDELEFNKETKEISYKDNLLNGDYNINTPKSIFRSGYDFFGLKLALENNDIVKGKIIKGKLEDVWEFAYSNKHINKEVFVTFKKGIAEGGFKEIINDTISVRGNYKNNNKNGVWKYFFRNGNVRKTITYKKGEVIGAMLYYSKKGKLKESRTDELNYDGVTKYFFRSGNIKKKVIYEKGKKKMVCYFFRNGKLREERTDELNYSGVTKYYYLNGNLESEITFTRGKIDINKSFFYDEDGKLKETVAYELYKIKNKDNVYRRSVDVTTNEYKNKVHILYTANYKEYLGYEYYRDGKLNGPNRSFIDGSYYSGKNRDSIFYTKRYVMSLKYFKNDSLRFEKNNSLNYDANNNLIKSIDFIGKERIRHFTYLGLQGGLTEYCEYKRFENDFFKEIIEKDGVYKKYNKYGELIEEKKFIRGEEQ